MINRLLIKNEKTIKRFTSGFACNCRFFNSGKKEREEKTKNASLNEIAHIQILFWCIRASQWLNHKKSKKVFQ